MNYFDIWLAVAEVTKMKNEQLYLKILFQILIKPSSFFEGRVPLCTINVSLRTTVRTATVKRKQLK